MVPTVEFPPTILSTLHVAPLTEAVNCCVCVVITTAARAGDTVTAAFATGEARSTTEPRVKKRELNLELLRIPASPKTVPRIETFSGVPLSLRLFSGWLNQFCVDRNGDLVPYDSRSAIDAEILAIDLRRG